jgi:hypothetical protein
MRTETILVDGEAAAQLLRTVEDTMRELDFSKARTEGALGATRGTLTQSGDSCYLVSKRNARRSNH